MRLPQIKMFCTMNEILNKIKRQPTEWENIFANDTCDKELISEIYKEIIQLISKRTKNPVKKQVKHLKRLFTKEDIQMDNRHEK